MSDDPTLPPRSDTVPAGDSDATQPPTAVLPPSAVLLRPGTPPLPLHLGRYRLDAQLGQGGMGAVYRAFDNQLGRTVALKVPFLSGPSADAIRARFLREAQSAAVLSHPNVCPVHDLGEIDGVPYLTMAFVQGQPLSKKLDPKRPMPADEAAALVRKVALALEHAHARGVIHRDLKPANVMIDDRGEPVVMDFGLARRADAALALTQEGELMGTPAYMPPEQVAGDVQAMGPLSDVYSLGVMLYEMTCGRPPFSGDLLSLVSQITSDPPPPPSRFRPGLDPRIDTICLKALAKRPADRFASMAAFAKELEPLTVLTVLPVSLAPSGEGRLTLRVIGTPFAYRPAPMQTVISLGRQKRRPGEPPEAGNDVVLRVPGNDALSGRISRRHLEIRRTATGGHEVIDRSKAGTLLNGRPLTRDVAAPLSGGDRIVVAGVLALEVELEGRPAGRAVAGEVAVPQAGNRVMLEASLGDLMTME